MRAQSSSRLSTAFGHKWSKTNFLSFIAKGLSLGSFRLPLRQGFTMHHGLTYAYQGLESCGGLHLAAGNSVVALPDPRNTHPILHSQNHE